MSPIFVKKLQKLVNEKLTKTLFRLLKKQSKLGKNQKVHFTEEYNQLSLNLKKRENYDRKAVDQQKQLNKLLILTFQ